jgi:hypothetical protein
MMIEDSKNQKGDKMTFNGSPKQNKWAAEILKSAALTDEQIDNLLRWGGPTMYKAGVMDVTIIIDNRSRLTAYADALGKHYQKTAEEKQAVANEAANIVHHIADFHTGRN